MYNFTTSRLTALLVAALAVSSSPVGAFAAGLTNLRCEYLTDPLGIDVVKPRLSWVIEERNQNPESRNQKQTAYQVLVASTLELLAKDQGDLWDSGKVASDQSIQVEYAGPSTSLRAGKPLASRMECHWKVRVWDQDGKASGWSKPAFWSIGLLEPEDWNAKWITHPDPKRLSHPWLRRTFEVKEGVKRAVMYINAGSYYELHINGKKVSPYVLTPGVAKTDKRFHINVYDVASYLVKGKNCIAIWMGPGWHQGKMGNNYNAPIIRAELIMDSPSGHAIVGTDSSWRVKESCITQIGGWAWNNFGGEHFDAREFVPDWDQVDLNDSPWPGAREIPAPNVLSSWQACESARPGAPVQPTKIHQLKNGKWVIDFGRPLTGWMRLRMHDLKPGQEVKISYADVDDNDRARKLAFMVNADGFQDFHQNDVFISAGNGAETFCSRFNYHSFRYAVISGLNRKPEMNDAEAMMIEPELESAG